MISDATTRTWRHCNERLVTNRLWVSNAGSSEPAVPLANAMAI